MRIAVAMTTCNGARHLGRQLESLSTQERVPDVLVVSDDASADGTLDILGRFTGDAPFPVEVIVNTTRQGFARNVSAALARAATLAEVVAPCDHDDVWPAGKLAAIEDAFRARPAAALWFSDAELMDENELDTGVLLSELVSLDAAALAHLESGGGVRRLLHGGTISNGTMAVRSEVIGFALPVPEDREGAYPYFFPDAWLAIIATLRGEIATDHRPLLRYRRHAGQMSEGPAAEDLGGRDRADRVRRHLARVTLVLSRVREHPGAGWNPARVEELEALEAFLTARAMPRGAGGRLRALFGQARIGAYARFAGGMRTFASDLLPSRVTSPRR
jgi:glycosyltransferase involved in cell wall biosynthesis